MAVPSVRKVMNRPAGASKKSDRARALALNTNTVLMNNYHKCPRDFRKPARPYSITENPSSNPLASLARRQNKNIS